MIEPGAAIDIGPSHYSLLDTSTTPGRWLLKKTARNGLAVMAWASGSLAFARVGGPRCHVLTYHRFAAAKRDPFAVSPQAFERQIAYLAEHRLAVSLQQVLAFVSGSSALERDAVLVTMDDGLQSVDTEARPILERYGVPAVAYITSGLVGVGRGSGDHGGGEPYMTWDEVARLPQAGIELGSHAFTHRSIGNLSQAEMEDEAGRSKDDLQRHSGQSITSFAYPFGTRADFNPLAAEVLRRAGYSSAFTSQHGAVRAGDDALTLPRVKVEGGEGQWLFRLLARGGMNAWRLIDHNLWRLQARNG